MNVSIHPSHWFHHAAVSGGPLPAEHRVREVLHNGAFWALVTLMAIIVAMVVLAILTGGQPGSAPYAPFYGP